MTDSKNMRNEDFRRLLATPSAHSSSSTSVSSGSKTKDDAPSHSFTHRQTSAAISAIIASKAKPKKKFRPMREKTVKEEEDDIFNESQARLNEVLSKYRDRAAERRKGLLPEDEADLNARLTAAYRAVPGTLAAATSLAERRRMEIQKSKYLGGDMEHTHLVKGLDFSLLNKVKGEIEDTEKDRELEEALEIEEQIKQPSIKQANTKLAKNISQVLFESKPPVKNELFVRGRMAYVVDLEDEVESDVPSTLLRSVHDCPVDRSNENVNADNVLINKLTQVLAYLRADTKKRKRGELDMGDIYQQSSQKIFDDVDEYVPKRGETSKREDADRRDRERKGERPSSYFDSKSDDRKDRGRDRRDRDRDRDYRRGGEREDREDRGRRDEEREPIKTEIEFNEDNLQKIKKRRLEQEDAYAELYPGGIGMMDAGGESDDEADYTKMDMGNRKGPVKRWDFDNQDDYEQYQGAREAMPKAAYQYGVKMSGGRKTRKNAAADEKKIDRELEKINKIMEKRKSGGPESSSKIRY